MGITKSNQPALYDLSASGRLESTAGLTSIAGFFINKDIEIVDINNKDLAGAYILSKHNLTEELGLKILKCGGGVCLFVT